MSVSVHVDCDGANCLARENNRIRLRKAGLPEHAYFATTEGIDVEHRPEPGLIYVSVGFVQLPEGWRAEEVEEFSPRYPDGLRYLCPGCPS